MRTWKRALYRTFCGFCGCEIERGVPMLVIQACEEAWKKARCQVCAGEVVSELPPLVVRDIVIEPTRKSLRPDWRGVATMAADYKLKQAGE